MKRIFILILFLLPLLIRAQSPLGVNLQSTTALNAGNQNVVQTRNKIGISYLFLNTEKNKKFKNTLNTRYDYGEVNRVKNMSEIYLGNFSKLYFRKKWRALGVLEKESSYMRAIKSRDIIGIGLGYDTKSGINFSIMGFNEVTKWENRSLNIFRASFRVETEHQLKEKVKLTTQIFLQPDWGLKYSRASGNASLSIELIKGLFLTSNLNTSYEQWVPIGRKRGDFSLSLGISYKRG